MVLSERSTVAGVFTEDLYAELAADELRRVGFSDDEISVLKHGATAGGFIDNLKGLFTGQPAARGTTTDDLIRLGVPEQNADYYEKELEDGNTVVLVRVAGQKQEVLEILRQKGAKTSPGTDQNAQTETNSPPMAPDMYDPITNREPGDSMLPPEKPIEP